MKPMYKIKGEAQYIQKDGSQFIHDEWEIERVNAKLRHFRGIAVSVMNDALTLWQQIWECCQDNRTCEEILDGIEMTDSSKNQIPLCGWPEFRERLYLLRHYIDYAKRLCEGSISEASINEASNKNQKEESGV